MSKPKNYWYLAKRPSPQKKMEDVQVAVSRILCQPSPSWAQLQKSAEISESIVAISDPRRDTFDDKTWRHGTATAGLTLCFLSLNIFILSLNPFFLYQSFIPDPFLKQVYRSPFQKDATAYHDLGILLPELLSTQSLCCKFCQTTVIN